MHALGEICEGRCSDCKGLEEEIYWKHFQSLHFCQILPKNFHHLLVIPKKFAENMWTKLPPRVSLKGPSGATWDVDLVLRDGIMYFLNGWEKFAKAYSLEENDILIFKYSGSSSFDVVIFSGSTFCEREAVYFIRKCGQRKLDAGSEKRRDVRQVTSEDEDSELVATKRARNDVLEESDELEDDIQRAYSVGPAKNRRKELVGNGDCPKESGRIAAGEPCIATDMPTSRVRACSSGKADNLHAEDDNGTNGRKSSAVVRNKPSINANAAGKSPLSRSYSRRGRSKKLAPSNSSVELIADSGEDVPTCETGEPIELTPTSAEQSRKNHHESIPRKIPLKNLTGKTRLKRPAPRRVLTKTVPLTLSIKPKPKPKSAASKPSVADGNSVSNVFNSKHMTWAEKQNAYQLADQEFTEGCFIKVMRYTYVSRYFYMPLPPEWVEKNMSPRNQDVTLRVGEKTWTIKFTRGTRGAGILCGGWKKFVLDNTVGEFDVCLFKLASQKDEPLVLDVKIFRVA
ncbi:B3 domain-containing protein [Drosera capensis]